MQFQNVLIIEEYLDVQIPKLPLTLFSINKHECMSIQSEDLQAILEIEAESRKLAAEAKVLGPKAFLQHFSRK